MNRLETFLCGFRKAQIVSALAACTLVLGACDNPLGSESTADIDESVVTDSNSGSADTTPPTFSSSNVNTTATDTDPDRGPTAIWVTASDAEGSVSYYEIAIAEDNTDSTCNSSDFGSTPSPLNWIRVPASANFSSSGYQIVNGNVDGSAATISLALEGGTDYCTAVRATDDSGNTSDPIYSTAVWNFTWESCKEANDNLAAAADGIYEVDPDGTGSDAAYNVYCDMSTQGGGWTLVIRYDSSEASAGDYALPSDAGRSAINSSDMTSLNATGNMAASVDIRPYVTAGAEHFMHVGKADDAATNSTTYVRYYFSEIYQDVIDTPANLFDSTLDTNNGSGVSGSTSNWNSTKKDRWFESDFTEMTQTDTDGNNYQTRIDGGEGAAMFTNGSREGALYSSGTSNGSVTGHSNPKVQWGFRGADGTQQTYGGTTYIGTYCHSGLGATQCQPESQMNLMFVR